MDILMQLVTLSVVLVVVLLAQWKTVRALNNLNSLMMFYGKQIEEIRRMTAGVSRGAAGGAAGGAGRDMADEAARGMYEILTESDDTAKAKPRPAATATKKA